MLRVGYAAPYRFDELGWVLFERLCDGVLESALGIDPGVWLGHADACDRVAMADDLRLDGTRLPAPCLVVVAWCRPAPGVSDRGVTAWVGDLLPVMQRELTPRAGIVRSVLVVSDVEIPIESLGELASSLGVPVQAVGPRWLGSVLDADPALRRRLPFVLGVRDLDPALAAGSTFDLAAAASLSRVFVPTQAYDRALVVVERHGFAVLTGPPEMGKTAIARMIALACLTDGRQVVECAVPDELWAAYAPDRRQVFVVDDAFGSTEYRPEAAERWALDLDRALRAMGETHWLLWTSRPAPFEAGLRRIHREHGVERFPRPAEVQVDASALTTEEKALMLLRHARQGQLRDATRLVMREHGWSIVSHPHFTPERIRRFAQTHLPALLRWGITPGVVARAIEREIREPTEGMCASLAALDAERVSILVALLDSPAGPVPTRLLATAARRHDPADAAGPVERRLAGLVDHFIRFVGEEAVDWVHPSWRDLVVEEVARSPERRRRFLARAQLDGLLVAMSTAGGAGQRVFPFLVDDGDWDELAGRLAALARDAAEPDLHRLLLSIEEAHAAARGDRDRREIESLAATVLDRVRDRWDGASAVALPQLEAWFRLRGVVAASCRPPSLDRAWIELLPTAHLDLADPGDLRALDDWLTLVGILTTHAPDVLASYGYPESHVPALRSLLTQAGVLALRRLPPSASDPLADVLRRLASLAPLAAPETVQAHRTADLLEEPDERWFELRLDPVGPKRPRTVHDRELVRRILLDL